MKQWNIQHGKDGYRLVAYETPAWALAAERAGETLMARTKMCGCCSPQWLWKIPFGRPRRDDDGELENSVAGALYSLHCKVASLTYFRRSSIVETPMTREQGDLLWRSDRYWEEEEEVDEPL